MTFEEARRIVLRVALNWPTPEWDQDSLEFWMRSFMRLPAPGAEAAIEAFVQTRQSTFRPVLAEALSAVVMRLDEMPGFEQAWAEMSSRAGSGNYFAPSEPPVMSHPLINDFARALGWERFRMSDSGDVFYLAQARKVFDSLTVRRSNELIEHPELLGAHVVLYPGYEVAHALADGEDADIGSIVETMQEKFDQGRE